VKVLGLGDNLADLRNAIADWKPDVAFNLLEEFYGLVSYDHYVVAYLELMRQPYTGCNPRGMMISRDKVLTKQVLASHRIPTPRFQLFPVGQRFREPRRLSFPLFVKSATDDASLGISQASVVEDMARLRERVEFIHEQTRSDALVEEYIDGRELYVGVLGNERLTALPAWEMDFGTLPEVQSAIVDVLLAKSVAALRTTGLSTLVIAGGVSANRMLRERLAAAQARHDFRVHCPEPALCTDNGAMIAFAGALRLQAGEPADGVFTVRPRWDLSELDVPA
jgi:biotin carboxylase